MASTVTPDAIGDSGDALVDSLWRWPAEVRIAAVEELLKLGVLVMAMTVLLPAEGRVMLRSEVPVPVPARARAEDRVSIRWGKVKGPLRLVIVTVVVIVGGVVGQPTGVWWQALMVQQPV